jgi:aminopeptidase YwaD
MGRILRWGVFFFALFATVVFASPHNAAVLDSTWIQKYLTYLSGDIAFDHVARISGYNRFTPSPGYDEAALYVEKMAHQYGLSAVEVHRYPADGSQTYWTWRSFPEWDGHTGDLWWSTPGSGRIASFEETPVSLAVYSQTADVTADVVDIGYGFQDSDYEGKDVRGKLVFTTGFPSMVYQKAIVERGAAGIITWYNEATEPDAAAWLNLPAWNVNGGRLNRGPKTFAFVLSFYQGRPIKQALQRGQKVVLHAHVEASARSGNYEVVTATIPGSDPAAPEIWFSAHLDHQKPGANDNASGAGTILEIARSLEEAIRSGAIPRPNVTLRFLWMPEMIGDIMFVKENPQLARNVIGDFNLDTVGEYQSRLNSSLWVVRPPFSRSSFFSDIAENLADYAIRNNHRPLNGNPDGPFITSPSGTRAILNGTVVPYFEGSDQLVFNDGTIAIPSVGFIHYPDATWHTNEDKIENVDATTLKRVAFMAGAAALTVGWRDAASFEALLTNSVFYGELRLAQDRSVANGLLTSGTHENMHLAGVVLEEGYARERSVLDSLTRAIQYGPEHAHELEAAHVNLRRLFDLDRNGRFSSAVFSCDVKAHLDLGSGRPTRTNLKGPLDQYRNVLRDKLGSLFDKSAAAPYIGSVALYEALNYADGSRTMIEIYHTVAAESLVNGAPLPEPGVFKDFFSLLQQAGVVTIR